MSEETNETTPVDPAAPVAPEELIMCYISKKMVPLSETVEVKYGPTKKYRVLPRYVRY